MLSRASWYLGYAMGAQRQRKHPPNTWNALTHLGGVDLKVSPREYLHSEEDIRHWIKELEKSDDP